jgi:hypothetical protein
MIEPAAGACAKGFTDQPLHVPLAENACRICYGGGAITKSIFNQPREPLDEEAAVNENRHTPDSHKQS